MGYRKRLIALQSADNSFYVTREVGAFGVWPEEHTYNIRRADRGLLATKEN